jgi:hypothetical protein
LRLRLVKRPSAEYDLYASTKTPARHRERSGEAGGLVRPCSSEKLLIYELETYRVPNTCYVIYGWALGNELDALMIQLSQGSGSFLVQTMRDLAADEPFR